MAELFEHIKDCQKLFKDKKKGYRDVHAFLDQYATIFPVEFYDTYHRTFLHNSYGLAIIRAIWGEKAHTAGLIHLYRDYLGHPIISSSLDNVMKNSGKAIMDFNSNLYQFEPKLDPRIIAIWKGKGLVAVALEDEIDRKKRGDGDSCGNL